MKNPVHIGVVSAARRSRRFSAFFCSVITGISTLYRAHGAAVESPSASSPNDNTDAPMLDATPILRPPKPAKHEISASGDFFFGDGKVSVPFGYSIGQSLPPGVTVNKTAALADRTSVYFGGTVSYSYGQAWYFDVSYLQGQQTAQNDVSVPFTLNGPMQPSFDIKDDWYQAYVRYTFPKLRGKPFSAYLRVGFSYVQADLTADAPTVGYHQSDKTTDMLGNVGFGVAYNVFNGRRFRVYLQAEGEGFGGTRNQDTLETLSANSGTPQTATINNTIYGGIGRATVRLEYRLGSSGLFKLFTDGGYQARFNQINYPGIGSQSERLMGPYVKIGARYSF